MPRRRDCVQREDGDLAVVFVDFKVDDQRGDDSNSRVSITGFAERDGIGAKGGFDFVRSFADRLAIGGRHSKFRELRFGRGIPDDGELHR